MSGLDRERQDVGWAFPTHVRLVELRHLWLIDEHDGDTGVIVEALGIEDEFGQHQQLVGDDRLVLLIGEEDVHPSPSSAVS